MGILAWFQRLRPPTGAPAYPSAPDDRSIGAYGEHVAENFLREKGYRILARNWRHRRDEIDIVAAEEDRIVFVEVKTRARHSRIGGYDALDVRKRRALRRAANGWMNRMRRRPTTWRLDMIEVRHGPGTDPEVRHYIHIPF